MTNSLICRKAGGNLFISWIYFYDIYTIYKFQKVVRMVVEPLDSANRRILRGVGGSMAWHGLYECSMARSLQM